MKSNKEKYVRFCEENVDIPVFLQPWWLDAVSTNGYWDVLLYERNDEVLGVLVYYVKKKRGLLYITQPQLTQKSGLWIKYSTNLSPSKKLSYEKEVMFALIEQLEKLPIVYYQQTFDCSFTNWLPFYWKNFKQTTCYTYRLYDLKNEKALVENYSKIKRKELNKALKQGFSLKFDMSAEQFYDLQKYCYKQRGRDILYDLKIVKNIVDAVYEHDAGRILYLIDSNGNVCCADLVVKDKNCAYSLIGSTNPDYANSGASTLLFHECIKYFSEFVDIFDFEGSMVESIEETYKRFGSCQVPYFSIHKITTHNILLKLLFRLNGL